MLPEGMGHLFEAPNKSSIKSYITNLNFTMNKLTNMRVHLDALKNKNDRYRVSKEIRP